MKKNVKSALISVPFSVVVVGTIWMVVGAVMGLQYLDTQEPSYYMWIRIVLAITGLLAIAWVAKKEYKRNS